MKWKFTVRFLIFIVVTVLVVSVIDIVAFIRVITPTEGRTEKLFSFIENPLTFTRSYQKYINIDNGKVDISYEGRKQIKYKNLWIQILDTNGNEVLSLDKPSIIPTHYAPADIAYENIGNRGKYTIFIESKGTFSYIIGFPVNDVSKYTFYYSPPRILNTLKQDTIILLIGNALIVILIGYIFGRWVTKPVLNIIAAIKILSQGDYDTYYEPQGIYSEVWKNFNNLSKTLKNNEIERKETENMREEWITNISHDIKTPLSSIKGYSEILSSKEYEISMDEVKRYADVIQNKSSYIQSLVDDLSLTYKLKSKMFPMNKKKKNIVEVIRESVIDILNDKKYNGRKINFECEIEYIEMNLDELLIKRAVSNLIYNAILHNDCNTQIWIRIYKNIEKIVIEVEDNGKGISKKDIKHVFERYYRGTNTGELFMGSGLGLAIAKGIIEAHQGKISISSSSGNGTKITIIFNA